MKTLIILFLFPLQIFAQDITGLWTGFIHTTDKDLPYELAISDNDGKLSGYSHTTFTVNGMSEIGVKAITIKNKNGNVLIEDEGLIFNDFSEAPAKGVKQSDFLILIIEDTAMMLNGTFKTNKTRIYRSVSGSIQLRKTDTSKRTKIIPKLNELNLLSTLSFLKPKIKEKEQIVITSKADEKLIPIQLIKKVNSTSIAKISTAAPVPKSKEVAPTPVTQNKPEIVASIKPKELAVEQIAGAIKKPHPLPLVPKEQVVIQAPPVTQKIKPEVNAPTKPKDTAIAPVVLVAKKKPQPLPKEKVNPVVIAPKPVQVKKEQPVVASKTEKAALPPLQKAEVKPLPVAPIVSAAEVNKRKTETIQSVYFKSDSLVINLYDNGEVDGDTVSVVLNGKVILANQGLSTNAITKTIYITPELGDSLQLVMYAENLGTIPPNTGLLILQDGNDRYEIRFAGDFQKNSAVILRRRKN